MEVPPLTIDVLRLTPSTTIPGVTAPSPTAPVPATALPLPSMPPSFTLSSTSNHPGPFGFAALGETLHAHVRLINTSAGPVRGAKMMVEVQSPGGRYRLGEVIHGRDGADARAPGVQPSQAESNPWEALPTLVSGDAVEVEGRHEIAEMGQHILICSIAWETPDGRRTFQRFLKFNVNAPLAIKTRVYTPTHPNAALTSHRGDVYLEVLMQNVSASAMVFESVVLNPVPGLIARSIGAGEAAAAGIVDLEGNELGEGGEASGPKTPSTPSPSSSTQEPPSLLSGDTTQRLFVLTPTDDGTYSPISPTAPTDVAAAAALVATNALPLSAFPPSYATGTVLPLGRLDIGWVAGAYREQGRFQTSMLNRRTPAPPAQPLSRPSTPARQLIGNGGSARSSLVRPLSLWEFDLMLDTPRSVPSEDEFTVTFRLAVRSAPVTDEHPTPPPPLQLGIQLVSAGAAAGSSVPSVTVRPPSRVGTPNRQRPASPVVRSPAPSRPMTPVSAQLRHAVVSNIASPSLPPTPVSGSHSTGGGGGGGSFTPPLSVPPAPPATAFPPPPTPAKRSHLSMYLGNANVNVNVGAGQPATPTGRVLPLGASLHAPAPASWRLTRERPGTSAGDAHGQGQLQQQQQGQGQYAFPSHAAGRWEATYAVNVRFLALAGGLAGLGGARVMLLDEAAVAHEWDSLGDVWVVDE